MDLGEAMDEARAEEVQRERQEREARNREAQKADAPSDPKTWNRRLSMSAADP